MSFKPVSEYEVLRCEPFTVNIVVDAGQFNTYSQPSSVLWPRGYETRRLRTQAEYHNRWPLQTRANRHFQPEEGPNRGLLRDCTSSRNLRQGSFEALVTAADPGYTTVCGDLWLELHGDTGRAEGSQSWHDTDGEWAQGAGAGAGAATGGIKSEDYQARGHWTHYTGTR